MYTNGNSCVRLWLVLSLQNTLLGRREKKTNHFHEDGLIIGACALKTLGVQVSLCLHSCGSCLVAAAALCKAINKKSWEKRRGIKQKKGTIKTALNQPGVARDILC